LEELQWVNIVRNRHCLGKGLRRLGLTEAAKAAIVVEALDEDSQQYEGENNVRKPVYCKLDRAVYVDCSSCSLSNYGRDCENVPISKPMPNNDYCNHEPVIETTGGIRLGADDLIDTLVDVSVCKKCGKNLDVVEKTAQQIRHLIKTTEDFLAEEGVVRTDNGGFDYSAARESSFTYLLGYVQRIRALEWTLGEFTYAEVIVM